MKGWAEPAVRWHARSESLARHEELIETAELLARWPAAPSETTPTDCLVQDATFWIWQPGVGGVSFRADAPAVDAYPAHDVDSAWFENVVFRNWLPAVYQVWGRQVLHASAAVDTATGEVVVFTGPSGAGKSTLAFGLGQQPGWLHVADDTLAFGNHDGRIVLYPLRNEARLRPASAAHYGRAGLGPVDLHWPDMPLEPRRLFVLDGRDVATSAVRIDRLKASECYPLLLEQAHAFTLSIARFNRQLMRDYLALAAAVPAYRLAYRRSFDDLDELIDRVRRAV